MNATQPITTAELAARPIMTRIATPLAAQHRTLAAFFSDYERSRRDDFRQLYNEAIEMARFLMERDATADAK